HRHPATSSLSPYTTLFRSVEKRIVELRGLMNEAGENSLNEMGQITSGPIDISELIENSVKAVKGKELSEALLQFANVYRGARAEDRKSTRLNSSHVKISYA